MEKLSSQYYKVSKLANGGLDLIPAPRRIRQAGVGVYLR